ncbi:tripartite tricarboxylate transporter permease [Georhizobium sp. MAB10]|uniref:tripartite tricarboxylate transporter permease n=1 Tax=Georhizobium sp. MAB10 TaxID=3028319 RepID=UPI0038559BEF
MIDNILLALEMTLTLKVVAALCAGVVIGYFVGALPGLTSSIGMALLIPFTFGLDPIAAIVMLVTIYMAADYAGGIPAILVNAPGQPAAAVTAFDGFPMSKRGEAGKALNLSIMASAAGALTSGIFLVVSAQGMASAALAFGPAEYFALAVLGLSLVGVLSAGSVIKALLGLMFGLVIITIGIDPMDGSERFVFTFMLIDGIPFLPALIGLFALSEVFVMVENARQKPPDIADAPSPRASLGSLWPFRRTVLRSSIIGYVVGVIPGAGGSIASLVSYGVAKKASKDSASFGTGNPEGVVASEAANNAAVSGALAPLLSLGVPGSASAAVLIGGLTIQGLQPGPLLFRDSPEVPYSIFVGLFLGLPIMVLVGLLGVRLWVKITTIPQPVIATTVASICMLGAYAAANDTFEMIVTAVFGVIGYVFRKAGIHPAPIVLALVLGDLMESNLRRALVMGGDSVMFILTKPIAIALLLCALAVLLSPLLSRRVKA